MPLPETGRRLTATALLLAWVGVLAASVIVLAHGVEFSVGSLRVRAHSPIVPALIAVVCLAMAFRRGRPGVTQALSWAWAAMSRTAAATALCAAAFSVLIGAMWGTYVAGGSDSYCYLNQAELLAGGHVRELQPLATRAPWPNAIATFVPTGHVAAMDGEAAIVPGCPSGYPLMMAAARRLAGRAAMFWVVPLLGGCAVWFTFVLGRQLAGPLAGASAAVWLAVSPTFLYQITQPMTDVPAVALWTAALVVTARAGLSMALGAGFLTGAALLIRPNLFPLVPATAALLLVVTSGDRARRLTAFALGVLPGFVAILLLNDQMFGGPLSSGYGRFRDLFTPEHIAGNLARYPMWLLQTQTPLVLLSLAAPFVIRDPDRRKRAWWMLAFVLVTFGCYIPYTVWDAWWFLRFVLPAFPPLLVLGWTTSLTWLSRAPAAIRTLCLAGALGTLAVFELMTSVDRAVFELRDLEARYRSAGEYVSQKLPANAIVFAVTQSGSVRFYSGRPTLRWSELEATWLERAVSFLTREGYHAYFLFEPDEEPDFRARFGGTTPLGGLDWPPVAEIDRRVRIYDPGDAERFRRGERVVTDVVFPSVPRRGQIQRLDDPRKR